MTRHTQLRESSTYDLRNGGFQALKGANIAALSDFEHGSVAGTFCSLR